MIDTNEQIKQLDQFVQNMKQKHSKYAGFHNLYIIQTEDLDGNITDLKFGMNLLTDLGLQCINADVGTKYVAFGDNSVEPSFTDISFTGDVLPVRPQITDTNVHAEPLQYDSETDMISQRQYIGTCALDYNINGVNTDVTIYRFGILNQNSASSNLMVHSKIYDISGQISSVTKRMNERLTMHVYMNGCIKSSIISTLYNQGKYFIIPGMWYARFQGQNMSYTYYCNAYRSLYQSYGWFLINHQPTSYVSYGSFFYGGNNPSYNTYDSANHTMTSERGGHLNFFSYIMSGVSSYISQLRIHVDAWFELSMDVKLSQPEELSVDFVYTDDYNTGSLAKSFASIVNSDNDSYVINNQRTSYGCIPCVDFTMTDSKMYDYSTHSWSIQDTFHSPTDGTYAYETVLHCYNAYDGTSVNEGNRRAPMEIVDAQGNKVTVFVRVNRYPNIPIEKFVTNGLSTIIYATDTYWDGSTYEKITTYSTSIPQNLRNKKYYLTTTDIPLRAVYINQDVHSITTAKQCYEITVPDESSAPDSIPGMLQLLSSTTKHWIFTYNHLIYPNAQGGVRTYTVFDEPIDEVTLIDTSQSIQNLTWISGQITSDGSIVANDRYWYSDEYFDISDYPVLSWHEVIQNAANGALMYIVFYDSNHDFIKLITHCVNWSTTQDTYFIYDQIPDNAKYIKFLYYKGDYWSSPEPSLITKLSYAVAYPNHFRFTSAQRFSTADRIILFNYNCGHGGPDHFSSYSTSHQWDYGYLSHAQFMLIKVSEDPTVAPTYNIISIAKALNLIDDHYTLNIFNDFDSDYGFMVSSLYYSDWNTSTARKIVFTDIYGIDAGTSDRSDNSEEVIVIGDGYGCMISHGMGWCAYFDALDSHKIHVYDLVNRVEIWVFELPQEEETKRLVTFNNYIYVVTLNGSKKSTFLCDISLKRYEMISAFDSPSLYDYLMTDRDLYFRYAYNQTDGNYREFGHHSLPCVNDFSCPDFIGLGFAGYSYGNTYYLTRFIKASNPREWTSINPYNGEGWLFMCPYSTSYGTDRLLKTDDGKHILIISSRSYNDNYPARDMRNCVIDVGMLMDDAQSYRLPNQSTTWFPFQNAQFRHTENAIWYYDDGIIQYSVGKIHWSPLAYWLPHKVTGSTYTIQSYNNPKRISGGSALMQLTNRIPSN